MICKYCGAEYMGNKCPSCGKVMPLVKRSTELDVLMDGNPVPQSTGRTFEQGVKEGYQKGLKEGYDNGYKEGSSRTSPPRRGGKWLAVLCASLAVFVGVASGIINNKLGYNRGYRQGTDAGIDEGIQQGIQTAQSAYESQISDLKEQHQTELEHARSEGYQEGYDKGHDAAKAEFSSVDALPTPTPEQAPPIETTILSEMSFPYSRLKNKDTYDLIVEKIQKRLKELEYKIKKVDGFFGPNTENIVKQYQKDNHLPQTGEVDIKMYRLLFPEEAIPEEEMDIIPRTSEPDETPQQKDTTVTIQPSPDQTTPEPQSTPTSPKTEPSTPDPTQTESEPPEIITEEAEESRFPS